MFSLKNQLNTLLNSHGSKYLTTTKLFPLRTRSVAVFLFLQKYYTVARATLVDLTLGHQLSAGLGLLQTSYYNTVLFYSPDQNLVETTKSPSAILNSDAHQQTPGSRQGPRHMRGRSTQASDAPSRDNKAVWPSPSETCRCSVSIDANGVNFLANVTEGARAVAICPSWGPAELFFLTRCYQQPDVPTTPELALTTN
jgi:hypothetical protein